MLRLMIQKLVIMISCSSRLSLANFCKRFTIIGGWNSISWFVFNDALIHVGGVTVKPL